MIPPSTIALWAQLKHDSIQERTIAEGIGEALIYDAVRKLAPLHVGRCETLAGAEVRGPSGAVTGMTAIFRCQSSGILTRYSDPNGVERSEYMCPAHAVTGDRLIGPVRQWGWR